MLDTIPLVTEFLSLSGRIVRRHMQPSDLFVIVMAKAERSVKEHLCVHRPCFGTLVASTLSA